METSSFEERCHLNLLVQVMEELFEDVLPKVAQLRANKQISFSVLWTIFPKDIILYSQVDGQDRLYQQEEAVLRGESYQLKVRFVQFNGIQFGTAVAYKYIYKFRGAKSISTLSIFPTGYHADQSLESRLLERGKRLFDFQDVRYREYEGIALDTSIEDCCDEESGSDTSTYTYVCSVVPVGSFSINNDY